MCLGGWVMDLRHAWLLPSLGPTIHHCYQRHYPFLSPTAPAFSTVFRHRDFYSSLWTFAQEFPTRPAVPDLPGPDCLRPFSRCPIRCPRPRISRFGTRSRHKKMRLSGAFYKADARTRTGDPFITSEALYQLSYVGDSRPASLAVAVSQEKMLESDAEPRRPRHSSARIAQRSWSRQRPPIFR